MTDSRFPDDADALVSAYLDGDLSPTDAARVEADPVLSARVEQLAAAATAIGDVPTPPAGALDDLVARALAAAAAADEQPVPARAADPTPPTVATRATARGPGRSRPGAAPRLAGRRRIGRVTAAAGLVLLLVVAVPLVLLVRSAADSSDSSSAASAQADSAALPSATGPLRNAGQDATAPAADAAAAAPVPTAGSLGSFATGTDLLAAARAAAAQLQSTPLAPPGAVGRDAPATPYSVEGFEANPCPALVGGAGQPALAGSVPSVLAGLPVHVLFVTRPDGTPAIIVASSACAVVLDAVR